MNKKNYDADPVYCATVRNHELIEMQRTPEQTIYEFLCLLELTNVDYLLAKQYVSEYS